MISVNLNNIAILNIQDVNYCHIINGISKCGAVNVLENADLTEKRSTKKIKKIKKFTTIYKIGKEITTFDNIEVEKHQFHQHKSPISIYDAKIDRIAVSNKVSLRKKDFIYFIGYEDDFEKIMLLCIMIQEMSAYRRDFEETRYMYF